MLTTLHANKGEFKAAVKRINPDTKHEFYSLDIESADGLVNVLRITLPQLAQVETVIREFIDQRFQVSEAAQ